MSSSRRILYGVIITVAVVFMLLIIYHMVHRTGFVTRESHLAVYDMFELAKSIQAIQHGTDLTAEYAKDIRNRRDRWGNDILYFEEDGRIVRIGSPGPDGSWDGGTGDDILIDVDRLEVIGFEQ